MNRLIAIAVACAAVLTSSVSVTTAQAAVKPGATLEMSIQDIGLEGVERKPEHRNVTFKLTVEDPNGSQRVYNRTSRIGGSDIDLNQTITVEGIYSVRAECTDGCEYNYFCGEPGRPSTCKSALAAELKVKNVAGRPGRVRNCDLRKPFYDCTIDNVKF